MPFITRAMGMHYIDSKNHKSDLRKKRRELFIQSYEVKIMPLIVDYGLGDGHTRMHIHMKGTRHILTTYQCALSLKRIKKTKVQ